MDTITSKDRIKMVTRLHLVTSIGAKWNVSELIDFLDSINYWYNLLLLIENLDKKTNFPVLNNSFLANIKGDKRKELNERVNDFLYQLPSSHNLQCIVDLFPDQLKLQLKSFNYNSPGKIDLLGIGEIVKQVKDFIIDVINIRRTSEAHRLSMAEKEEVIRSKRLDNLDKSLQILTKYEIPFEMLEQIYNQKNNDKISIKQLKRNQQIEEVTTYEEEE